MRVELRLFAIAKQHAGRPLIELELPEHATAADVKHALGVAVPSLAPILSRIKIAVDSEYADDLTPIPAGAQLAVIPPVSGGGIDFS
jgi:molybdopterin synthase catalytic subunit